MNRNLLFIISTLLCAIELYLFKYGARSNKIEVLFVIVLILILVVNKMMGVR